jgi:hypothetical protein
VRQTKKPDVLNECRARESNGRPRVAARSILRFAEIAFEDVVTDRLSREVQDVLAVVDQRAQNFHGVLAVTYKGHDMWEKLRDNGVQ